MILSFVSVVFMEILMLPVFMRVCVVLFRMAQISVSGVELLLIISMILLRFFLNEN